MRDRAVKATGILGFISGIAAIATATTYPSEIVLNTALAILSLILLLVFFIFHFESFKSFSRRRSTRLGLNSILMIALFVFIAVILNLIAKQYYFRADMSSTARFSLAPQTVKIIKNLDSIATITVFGQEGTPSFKRALELLDAYRYINRRIIYSVVDLDREPVLAKEYGIDAYDNIAIKIGNNKPTIVRGISEENITNGIIRSTRKTKKKIYFITGHGERDINNTGRSGMSKAIQRLKSIGYDISDITLFSLDSIPDEADLLVIAGPREEFSSEDILKIDRYVSQGGKLLAMFDPGYDPYTIIGKFGMSMTKGSVIDHVSNLGGRDEKAPVVSTYPDSGITRGFSLTTVFPGVAAIQTGGLAMFYEYFDVIRTSPESKLVTGGKITGDSDNGYVIAAAAGSKKGKDVILIFGDSDFASNAFLDVAGNSNLFLNAINWIAEQGDLVSIVPAKEDFIPLYLTNSQAMLIFYLFVVALPLLIFATGFTIWLRRRTL